MSDPLHSSRIKLQRADVHLQSLEREVIALLTQTKGQFRLGGEFDAQSRRYIQRVQAMPTMSLFALGVIIGDCVHNLRCSIDHLAWQLVTHGSDPNPKRPRDVQFPVYDTPILFRDNVSRRLPGVGQAAIAVIEAAQPYHGTDRPIPRLASLSNEDKHRVLVPIATVAARGTFAFNTVGCRLTKVFYPLQPPNLEIGTEVFSFTLSITDPAKYYVDVKGQIAPYIAFEDGTDVVVGLRTIREEITRLLAEPAILSILT